MTALLALVALVALAVLGARWPVRYTRATIVATLLLVPDVPSGDSFGLLVHWSAGLTLSNFVVPAVALPLLLGAWLAGKPLLPQRWPSLARWSYLLLGWGALTLLPPLLTGALGHTAALTVAAHWIKLALFLFLGVVLAAGESDPQWHDLATRWLCVAIAVNAGVGLAQAAGWLPTFSPLAAQRATGLFYDANMYAVLMAWAVVVLAVRPWPRWPAARWLLLALSAAALVGAGSRAGYLALGVGVLALVACGEWRPVLRLAPLALAALLLFPARTVLRIESSATTVWAAGPVVTAAPEDVSTAERLASMREALRQVAAHPVLGSGFGRALYLGLPAAGSSGEAAATAGVSVYQGAQNMPLTVLSSMGPVGLVLLLSAMFAPLAGLRRRALPHLAGYLGLLAACLTMEAFFNTRVLALLVLFTGGGL